MRVLVILLLAYASSSVWGDASAPAAAARPGALAPCATAFEAAARELNLKSGLGGRHAELHVEKDLVRFEFRIGSIDDDAGILYAAEVSHARTPSAPWRFRRRTQGRALAVTGARQEGKLAGKIEVYDADGEDSREARAFRTTFRRAIDHCLVSGGNK